MFISIQRPNNIVTTESCLNVVSKLRASRKIDQFPFSVLRLPLRLFQCKNNELSAFLYIPLKVLVMDYADDKYKWK